MRIGVLLGVLSLLAAPAMAGPVTYTFDLDGENSSILLDGDSTVGYIGSTISAMSGTFSVTIYQSDGHIEESNTFILGDAGLQNAEAMELGLAGIATATLEAGSARFLDFASEVGHIEPNAVINSDVYIEVTAIVTGLETTLIEQMWAGELLPFVMNIQTSVGQSETMTATMAGAYAFLIGVDLGGDQEITLDLIIDMVGTVHVPEPVLSGLTVLGLSGAGAWLRRRR